MNLDKEIISALRKAVIVENTYLQVEDRIQAGIKPVDIRWNMVTPATANIVDEKTIRLTQNGKVMLLAFNAEVPFKLVIRPSENPGEYQCEFGDYKYDSYNQTNKGTVMIGFDSKIPADKLANFSVTFKMIKK